MELRLNRDEMEDAILDYVETKVIHPTGFTAEYTVVINDRSATVSIEYSPLGQKLDETNMSDMATLSP